MAKGFRGGPKMGGQGNMMMQLQRLQAQMEEAQAKLAEETVDGTAGGGAVKVTMTGDKHCKAITIDPEVLKDGDVEMLQDLIITAVNTALDAADELSNQRLGALAPGGLGLPF